MRILYLTFDDLTAPYAWAVHVRAVVNGLVARGHPVRLVAPGGRAPGVRAPCDSVGSGMFHHLVGSLGAFLESGRAFGPDVLYVRGIHATVTPALAADRLRRPLVVEINGLLEEEAPSGWRRRAVRAAHRFTLARAARAVTVSPLLKEALSRRYGMPGSRIDVVPNGADTRLFFPRDREDARRELGLPSDRPIVVYVASFYPHHAVELLVAACAHAGARLVLVGGDFAGLPGVIAAGRVAHEKVPAYLAAADVCAYVLRAPHPEFGFSPLKVYESMAAGRPIAAATDQGEIRDFVNGEGVGIAVPLDREALAEALRRLLEDRALRDRMGRRGRDLAERVYNWDRAAAQVEESLRRACAEGKPDS